MAQCDSQPLLFSVIACLFNPSQPPLIRGGAKKNSLLLPSLTREGLGMGYNYYQMLETLAENRDLQANLTEAKDMLAQSAVN